MKYLTLLPLAGLALAAPPAWEDQGVADSCLAAVTGKAALGDDKLRKEHCSSFLHTIVTPPAVTVTETVTGKPGKDHEKRAQVTVCPNEVPNYASACDPKGYSAACGKWGVTEVKTETLKPTTTTVFVWVRPTGAHGGPGGPGGNGGDDCEAEKTITVTVTKDKNGATSTPKPGHGHGGDDDDDEDKETVTVTVTKDKDGATSTPKPGHGHGGDDDEEEKETITVTETKTVTKDGDKPTGTPSTPDVPDVPGKKCLTDSDAKVLVDNFRDLLEFTSYNGTLAAPGRGYHYNISAATLTEDFVDISDSINFMAGFKLGSITFPTRKAFDYGQGVLQPEVKTETLNIFHDCHSITWRWKLTPYPGAFPVVGINYFLVNEDKKIYKNYAEFSSGAWLQSLRQECARTPPTVVEGEFAKRSISA